MNKKALIKKALREVLDKRSGTVCTLERPHVNMVSINFGDEGFDFTFSEYDDNGDLCDQTEHDDIYVVLEALVNEHNAKYSGA